MEPKAFFHNEAGQLKEHTNSIVPLVRDDKKTGEQKFIGTAFYISKIGILCTAKHNLYIDNNNTLLTDNLGVYHFFEEDGYILRPITTITYAGNYDLAYLIPKEIHDKKSNPVASSCVTLTNHLPVEGEQLATYAYPYSKIIKSKDGQKADFNSQFFLGQRREFFQKGFSQLKNSCYQTSLKIPSGASGGPVFNADGKVFAVCSTGLDISDGGEDISFITPILPSFELKLKDGIGEVKSIKELISMKIISFES